MRRLGLLGTFAVALWCSAAYGQVTSTIIGKITDVSTGKSIEGAVVVVKSPALQGEQVAATDAGGRYEITLLPPGTYTIHIEATGYKAYDQGNIVLPLQKTIKVNVAVAPVAVVAKEVVVTAKQTATVDQGSTTTGIVLEKEFLEKIPLGRTYDSAFLLAPGTTIQDNRVGIGIGGATGAENNFLVDGFNTTNPGFGTLGATLPPEFLEQLEVKVGGYMPEFGRAMGGIINTVIQSGGNEFHGQLFFNYGGPWLEAMRDRLSTGSIARRDATAVNTDFGVAIGGPLLKDKLWFFVGIQQAITENAVNRYLQRRFQDPTSGDYVKDATSTSGFQESTVYRQTFDQNINALRYATKLTWAPSSDHRVSLTYFGNKNDQTGVGGGTGDVSVLNGEPSSFLGTRESDYQNITMNYSGKFLDKRLQLEANAGYARQVNTTIPSIKNGAYSGTYEAIGGTTGTGSNLRLIGPQIPEAVCAQDPTMRLPTCPVGSGYSVGLGLFGANNKAVFERGQLAAKVSLLLPRNLVKIGADVEWNTYQDEFAYGNGAEQIWRFRSVRDLNGDGIKDQELIARYVARGFTTRDPYLSNGNLVDLARTHDEGVRQRSHENNVGVFIQDSVTILDNLTFNGGFRWEIQQLFGTEGPSTHLDPTDPTSPLINSVLTLNKNVAPRAGIIWDPFKDGRTKVFGSFGVYYESVPLDLGVRSLSNLDIFSLYNRSFDGKYGTYVGQAGGIVTGVVNNINPQYNYEWIAGIEHEIIPSYRVGLTYTKRVIGNIIEDMSVDDGNTYFLGNPGKGAKALPNAAGTGGLPGGVIDQLMKDPQFNASKIPSECRLRAGYDQKTLNDKTNLPSMLCTGDFPTPVRDYDAWTVYFEKRKTEDQPWQFKVSYTLSWLKGNYSGLFENDNGQLDPNITSLFDLPSLLINKFGYLPQDHRHIIKLYGSYEIPKKYMGNHGFTVGIGLSAEAGGPLNAQGLHEVYRTPEVNIFPRGYIPDANGNPTEGRLPWLLSPDLFLEYSYQITKTVKLSFNAVIFNFLNLQEALFKDQRYTLDPVCPITGDISKMNISQLKLATGFDPVTGACTPGSGTVHQNPDYLKATLKQLPTSARFGLRLTF
jgi:outer membrane receptor protein involved in Fe transport